MTPADRSINLLRNPSELSVVPERLEQYRQHVPVLIEAVETADRKRIEAVEARKTAETATRFAQAETQRLREALRRVQEMVGKTLGGLNWRKGIEG